MHGIVLVLTAVAALAGPQPRPAMSVSGDTVTVPGCLVTLIGDVPVPVQEAGVLVRLNAVEGQQVAPGELLAQIDDSQAQKAVEAAIARHNAADLKAKNDVNVRYARISEKVYEAELKRSEETNRRAPGAVTQADMHKQWLELQRATLGIEQAEHDFHVAELDAQVAKAEVDAARLNLERRQIKAPESSVPSDTDFKWIVVKRFSQVGEWLKPGDPVLRLVRMDRLWIEGFLDAAGAAGMTPSEVDGKPVTVKVALPRGREEVLQGRIVFVSPIVEAGPQFLIKAEIINRQDAGHWVLRPGLNADMTIYLKR